MLTHFKIHSLQACRKDTEYRKSFYPTTSKIFYNFDGISSYKILKYGKVIKEFKDSLSSTQKIILDLLDMDENQYWGIATTNIKQKLIQEK